MGSRPRPESVVTGASVLLLSVLILLPLGVLVIRSLGEPWSLDLFERAFSNSRLRAVLQNTILVALLSTGFAVVVGVTLAWLTHRAKMRAAGLFDVLIIVPFFISPIVLAMTWLAVAGPSGLLNVMLRGALGEDAPQIPLESLTGITFIMGVYLVPYVYLYTSIGLKNIDPAYEEASYTLGGGTLRTAIRVTLPLTTPSILAGSLLAFVIAVSHFSIPLVLGRPHGIYVLTTIIYEMINYFPPDFAQAAAISLILLAISALGVWGQRSVLRRRSFVTVTGKARESNVRRGGRVGVAGSVFCGAYVVFIVIMPLATLAVVSCMSYFTFDGPRFTFAHYPFLFFEHPLTIRGIGNSLVLATVGATFTVLFTSVIGYIISKGRGRWRVLLDMLAMTPIAIPATAFAVALLATWIRVPFLYGTLLILLIAYATIYTPFGVRSATANLAQIHDDLESASRTSGAAWGYTFRRIMIPLMRPGMTAAWIIIFVSMLKEISASILLFTYGTETMSVVLVELWSEGSFPVASSMAIIQTVIVGLILVGFRRAAKADLRSLT